MTPLHLLFVTFDGGGNTPPTFGLVRRLRERGHRLTVLGQPIQQAAVLGLGATFQTLPSSDWGLGMDEVEVLFPLLFGSAVANFVLETVKHDAPDVLVIDCMMASALAAAERSGVASAALVHVLYRALTEGTQVGHNTLGQLMTFGLNLLNPTREQLGLPPVTSPAELLAHVDVALVTSSAHLNHVLPDEPANVRYVGAIRNEPLLEHAATPWWNQNDERPRVLVAFSTVSQRQEETLRRVRDALSGLQVQAIMTLGQAVNLDSVAPAENVAVYSFISHSEVLSGCDLVVTHSGLGTVQMALSHGVPLLCMPMGHDQDDNAARVQTIGAGLILHPEASTEDIRTAVETLLTDHTYRDAARRLAREMEDENGLQAAVETLERLAAHER